MRLKFAALCAGIVFGAISNSSTAHAVTISQVVTAGIENVYAGEPQYYAQSTGAGVVAVTDFEYNGAPDYAISGASYANGVSTFAFAYAPASGASAYSYLKYYFQINGPQKDIQLDIAAKLGVDYDGFAGIYLGSDDLQSQGEEIAYAYASCDVSDCTDSVLSQNGNRYISAVSNPTLDVNLVGTFSTNTIYSIELDTQVSAYWQWGAPNIGYAFVDPVVTIDQSTQDAQLYSLQFESGVANATGPYGSTFPELPSAVPEPSTWATMLFGLAGLGSFLRRQRNRRPGHHCI